MQKIEEEKPKGKNFINKTVVFIKQHKKASIIVTSALILVIAGIVIGKAIKRNIEENRDYYIAIDDEFTFDCNAHYDEKNKTIYCDEQTISGTFSNFDIVELYWVDKIEGNNFTYKAKNSIYKSEYEKENFNINDFNSEIKRNVTIYLKNNYLKKDVLRKEIIIHYHLSEADKALVEQKHNDWKTWKEAEDTKKAEQEANAQTQAEAKAKEEAQAQEKQAEQKTASRLPDDIVEQECQDAKYYIQSSYYKNTVKSLISISNYNFGVYEDAYDKDGDRILMARWNGNDKNKNAITFVCYISGSDKDNLTVHWISGNNVDIWKSEADLMYNTYDENGNKLQ
ncbi:MAG: cell envelope integrity protein TolA [Candidatus Saccharibacteria bacterium]|nr:cell envelope integrity protein TolA [Candidatus Saccharibacteria bacterium]